MTHPMNPPLPTCAECGADIPDLDGDWNACLYSGGACAPGGCDCGRASQALCEDCDPSVPMINVPVPFPGTPEERRANLDSHNWSTLNGEDYNCLDCDCKPGHVSAGYPCGADVPRHDVPYGQPLIGCSS